MRYWTTEIRAIDPEGKQTLYRGPNIKALTFELAEAYCGEHGLGYCKVTGELIEQEMNFVIYIN
jgi:hypothetical protein